MNKINLCNHDLCINLYNYKLLYINGISLQLLILIMVLWLNGDKLELPINIIGFECYSIKTIYFEL